MGKPFFPTNGSEGGALQCLWCEQCRHWGDCALLCDAFFGVVSEIKEWTWEPCDLRSIRCSEFLEAKAP